MTRDPGLKTRMRISLAVVTALIVIVGYVAIERSQKVKQVRRQLHDTQVQLGEQIYAANMQASVMQRAQRHYMLLYEKYAGVERVHQYGTANDSVALFYKRLNAFTPIETVTEKTICPKPVKALPDGYTFFGIRNIVLRRKGAAPLLYSTSYNGNHAFIRDRDTFDLLLDLGNVVEEKIVRLSADQAANMMDNAPSRVLTRNGGYITPFSYNTTDINGDGTDDFFYGGRLQLSSGGRYRAIDDASLDAREVVFADNGFLSPNGEKLERWELDGDRLIKTSTLNLASPVATNRPFTILPLDGALTKLADAIIVTASSYDFYRLGDESAERIMSVPLTAPHSLIIGARGDFDGDGVDDIWLSESRWKNEKGETVGRALLLSSRKFGTDAHRIEDLASFILYGTRTFTDYDGIGASLSPEAGDFDGDGKPDLSVSGHIHMNEAGVMYLLRGKDIAGKTSMTIDDEPLVRIVGRPVSNLAPPFVHYDIPSGSGKSKIVVAADNDLCSGPAGGAIYFVDPAPLLH